MSTAQHHAEWTAMTVAAVAQDAAPARCSVQAAAAAVGDAGASWNVSAAPYPALLAGLAPQVLPLVPAKG